MTKSVRRRGEEWFVTACMSAAILAAPADSKGQEAPPRPPAPQPRPAATTTTYRIGPGDTLQVFVWKEPDLTRDVTVRIDGKISVALLGDVQAAGSTPGELAEELTRQLKRFIASPLVTVGVNQPRSTRFFVLGQVARPGEFPLSGPTTLVQALAVAGGFRDYAKTDEIVILRQEGGASTFVPVNYKRLESGRDGSQNVLLRPGDTVLVP
jgi:polysaccharide export outer membrane protein